MGRKALSTRPQAPLAAVGPHQASPRTQEPSLGIRHIETDSELCCLLTLVSARTSLSLHFLIQNVGLGQTCISQTE